MLITSARPQTSSSFSPTERRGNPAIIVGWVAGAGGGVAAGGVRGVRAISGS
jgi:hypothetical protein